MSTPIYDKVRVGDIEVIALSREGGVSVGDFNSLNVANYVGDDKNSVARNIAIAGELVNTPNVSVMQGRHGNVVHYVRESGYAKPGDGLVTDKPELALLALAADCVPFALVDPDSRVVAVGHAGWKGVAVNVMKSLVDEFVARGGDPKVSSAVIGPSICGPCYEVPAGRVLELEKISPESILDERHIEVSAGVKAELERLSFKVQLISGCTLEDPRLFSYRRAAGAPTGRGGIIVAIPSS
jgi:YfiH family protein